MVECKPSRKTTIGARARFLEMKQIKRSAITGSILRIFGYVNHGIQLSGSGVTVLAPIPSDIPFRELSGPASLTRSLWFHAVSLPLTNGSNIAIAGVKHADAAEFVEAANQAWQHSFLEVFGAADEELKALSQVVERLSTPRRYGLLPVLKTRT